MKRNQSTTPIKLADFDGANAQPNARFVKLLATKMYLRFGLVRMQTTIEHYFPGLTSRRAALFSAFALLIPALLIAPTLINYAKIHYVQQTQDTTSIYQNALNKRLASSNQRAPQDTNLMSLAYDNQAELAPIYWGSEFSYLTQTVETVIGPKATTCNTYTFDGYGELSSFTAQTYTFTNPEDHHFYNKYVTYTQQGDLIRYSLMTPDETIEYQGGAYAVRFENNSSLYETPLDSTETTTYVDRNEAEMSTQALPTDSVQLEKSEVGASGDVILDEPLVDTIENKLVSTETINGIEYYIFESRYSSYCDEGTTTIQRYWINPTTEELFQEILYVNQVTPTQMIMTNLYEFSQQDSSFEEIKHNFIFDLDVPVRTISYDNEETLNDYLSTHQVLALLPADSDWIMNYAYSQRAEEEKFRQSYLFDREYYSPDNAGQKAFDTFVSSNQRDNSDAQPISFLQLNFHNTDPNLSLTIDSYKETTIEVILASYGIDSATASNNQTIFVSGTPVTARIYDQSFAYDIYPESVPGYPGEGSSDDRKSLMIQDEQTAPDSEVQYSYLIMAFDYQGFTFALQTSAYGTNTDEWLSTMENMTLYDSQNLPQRIQLLQQIAQAMNTTQDVTTRSF